MFLYNYVFEHMETSFMIWTGVFFSASTVTRDNDTARILQFVSTFHNSRLGRHLQVLSEEERFQYGRHFLQDFLLLSLKIKSKDELKVKTS